MARQGHVLQGEGILVGPAAPAVFQPAGLGAHAPVAAAAPNDRGEKALAGVAHAQSAVAEHLNFDGGVLADVGDLIPGQLTGEHHPAHPQVCARLDPVQGVDGHLGGGMDGQVGDGLADHPGDPQVLHQHCVYPDAAGVGGYLGRAGQLPVGEQGVQGQKDPAPPQMAVRNRRRSLLLGKILCVAAGVEISVSQINGVRPILDGGGDRLHRAGGSEQLQHGSCPLVGKVRVRPKGARGPAPRSALRLYIHLRF